MQEKILLDIQYRRRFVEFLFAFQGKTITKCIFGLNWAVSTLFTFTEFVYNFRSFLILCGKKIIFFQKRNWLLWNQTLTVLAKILMRYTYIKKHLFWRLLTLCSVFCIWFDFSFCFLQLSVGTRMLSKYCWTMGPISTTKINGDKQP